MLGFLFKHEIIRRYVVINSFDGALTLLGIILAVFFAGVQDPKLVILPGIGAAIAMCVSGMWGAYAAEISEVVRKRRELEKHLLTKIGKSSTAKERNKRAVIACIVNGLSPFIVSIIILIPFFFAFNLISISLAYYISIAIISIILFSLGMFTGFVAKEKVLKKGLTMLLAGIVIGVIFFILARLGWL
ncbi:VIT1/CCC1 transporter family protein [Candidatus Woesearchaeota archaeon]|nr:VIT1/CCC1 transporter family protein [Candidatus Woesearchaeota archaeon]